MKKGKRDRNPERFVKIPYEIITSAAWRTLKPRDVWVYVHLLSNWNSGEYTLPVSSVRHSCGWAPLRRALDNLGAAGFIERVLPAPGGMFKIADKYKLSDRWRQRSAALLNDETAGQAQMKIGLDGRPFRLFVPVRKERKTSTAVLNLKRGKRKPRKKPRAREIHV